MNKSVKKVMKLIGCLMIVLSAVYWIVCIELDYHDSTSYYYGPEIESELFYQILFRKDAGEIEKMDYDQGKDGFHFILRLRENPNVLVYYENRLHQLRFSLVSNSYYQEVLQTYYHAVNDFRLGTYFYDEIGELLNEVLDDAEFRYEVQFSTGVDYEGYLSGKKYPLMEINPETISLFHRDSDSHIKVYLEVSVAVESEEMMDVSKKTKEAVFKLMEKFEDFNYTNLRVRMGKVEDLDVMEGEVLAIQLYEHPEAFQSTQVYSYLKDYYYGENGIYTK